MDQQDSFRERLEQFRPYLEALARVHLDRRLWRKCDSEDVVHDTLCEALRKGHQFRGDTDGQLRAWLRRALLNNVLDLVRKWPRVTDDVDLEGALEASSRHIEHSLVAECSSPGERAARNEQLDRLACALARLPRDQHEAVILHHLEGLTLADVAVHLRRSPAAAAGLVHRGLKKLRCLLKE
jgi:RNA polymerase sigma-70 factor (ECF subfamily)